MQEKKEVTIYDIARHLNLSAATVSRGLKESSLINEDTKRRIKQAAKELGYRPNILASNLRTKRTKTLGVIVPRLNSYFMSAVLASMDATAKSKGYNLLIGQSMEKWENEKQSIQTMYSKQVDGLLISLAADVDTNKLDYLDPFTSKKIPVVFFDRAPNNHGVSVVIDNYRAACDITGHLVAKGCKKILHVSGNAMSNVYRERIRGFKDTLRSHGLKCASDQLLFIDELNEEAGEKAAAYILQMKNKPDGVFCANDTTAVHCMQVLKTKGMAIPGQIAFAGFNNDPISRVIEPQLTTINYPGSSIGQVAVNTLIDILDGNKRLADAERIVLQSQLVIRASSAK